MAAPQHPLQEGSFDPLALLRRAREGKGSDTRTTMLRMLWLRQRVPDTRVETAMVSFDERAVVMSATISVPGGGQGTGHAATRFADDTDLASAIESTETRAIGRALDVLGYVVTEAVSSGSQDRSPAAPPRPAPEEGGEPEERRSEPPGHVQALRQMKHRDRPPQDSPEQPAPVGPYPEMQEATAETPESRAEPSSDSKPPARDPQRETTTSGSDEPELEDVSWTAFWGWARTTYQLGSRVQLEELLGQPVGNKSPGQLRQLLDAHFAEDTDDES